MSTKNGVRFILCSLLQNLPKISQCRVSNSEFPNISGFQQIKFPDIIEILKNEIMFVYI
jgi:hypothetical protein